MMPMVPTAVATPSVSLSATGFESMQAETLSSVLLSTLLHASVTVNPFTQAMSVSDPVVASTPTGMPLPIQGVVAGRNPIVIVGATLIEPGMESGWVDLGKFLGFPSQEAPTPTFGNLPDRVQATIMEGDCTRDSKGKETALNGSDMHHDQLDVVLPQNARDTQPWNRD
ncbi:hypothetical protein NE237_009969 [Protea cynaroides]|uniref:Uncharacterized protein n=1 Tax=Protea cynaroides TaxID=273540 RepID=A0A9Q0KYW4_9MAGN|nr:hypothetical protein NE237_009969 [Protea cynaroides]